MTGDELLTAFSASLHKVRGATEFNAPAPRSTWVPIEAQHRALRHELLERLENERRHTLATRDYHECCRAIRALRLVCLGLRALPRTRQEVRLEVRFWVTAARRAKQVMGSTACPR